MSALSTRVIKAPKASATECCTLEQLPNIGPSLAASLRLIGIRVPADLRGTDPLQLYRRLCTATGQRQDPCVLDTFIAAIDFMQGAPAARWWRYTAQRKAQFGSLQPGLADPAPRALSAQRAGLSSSVATVGAVHSGTLSTRTHGATKSR